MGSRTRHQECTKLGRAAIDQRVCIPSSTSTQPKMNNKINACLITKNSIYIQPELEKNNNETAPRQS